ncbi:hypothetical protein JB92DRAFT_2867700 [Gautieria morchelliformis]|nr:hypothetical protein JB92DRAFT_2867700 [Gautieria morchelliformis]
MALSPVGHVRFVVYGVLLLVNTIVLALSAHINHFQQFFYRADVFPLALSVVTLVFVLAMVLLDINLNNAVTARPPFELAWLLVFGLIWLGFNAFSTSRWKFITLGTCRSIPSDAQYASYRTWCHEVQALRVLVWVEWVMFLCTFAYLLRWTIAKRNSGRHDVLDTPFSRFSDEAPSNDLAHVRETKTSEFLQWERFPQTSSPSAESPSAEYTRSRPQQAQYGGREQHNHDSRYPETQHTQAMEAPHAQAVQGQEPQAPYAQGQPFQGQYPTEAPYAQGQPPQGPHPIEAPYTRHPDPDPPYTYTPPSQAYFTPHPPHVPPSLRAGPAAHSFLPRVS